MRDRDIVGFKIKKIQMNRDTKRNRTCCPEADVTNSNATAAASTGTARIGEASVVAPTPAALFAVCQKMRVVGCHKWRNTT